jgi:hypothetical protein
MTMASRRTVTTRDRQRNSTARKNTHKAGLARQKQQAEVLARLWSQAKSASK